MLTQANSLHVIIKGNNILRLISVFGCISPKRPHALQVKLLFVNASVNVKPAMTVPEMQPYSLDLPSTCIQIGNGNGASHRKTVSR
jgi:hypothetical protein